MTSSIWYIYIEFLAPQLVNIHFPKQSARGSVKNIDHIVGYQSKVATNVKEQVTYSVGSTFFDQNVTKLGTTNIKFIFKYPIHLAILKSDFYIT